MPLKRDDKNLEFLFKAVLELEDIEECYDFFEDLCTVQELKSLSQRLVVAKMLSEKCVYTDIVNKTGASTATISRVNRSLQYGCDGYDKIFDSEIYKRRQGTACDRNRLYRRSSPQRNDCGGTISCRCRGI